MPVSQIEVTRSEKEKELVRVKKTTTLVFQVELACRFYKYSTNEKY